MTIEWSRLALAQVEEIAAYIAADDPDAARRWAASVFDAVKQLRLFPLSGRVLPERDHTGVRELIVGNYRIVYRTGDPLRVMAVRHVARRMDPGDE